MSLIVTRHGQSLTNIAADLNCRFHITANSNVLTETGIQDALTFGKNLKDQQIELDEIVCSTYARAKQTAFTIASVMASMAPITFDSTFTEIDWSFGHPPENVRVWEAKNGPIEYHLVDRKRVAYTTESQRDVYDRIVPAFTALLEASRTKNILLVTHFFVCRAIQSHMETGSPDDMNAYSPTNLCLLKYDACDEMAD